MVLSRNAQPSLRTATANRSTPNTPSGSLLSLSFLPFLSGWEFSPAWACSSCILGLADPHSSGLRLPCSFPPSSSPSIPTRPSPSDERSVSEVGLRTTHRHRLDHLSAAISAWWLFYFTPRTCSSVSSNRNPFPRPNAPLPTDAPWPPPSSAVNSCDAASLHFCRHVLFLCRLCPVRPGDRSRSYREPLQNSGLYVPTV